MPTTTGTVPGLEARLVRDRRESLAEYRAEGGYADPPADLEALVQAGGLRGRGGAAFPTARKIAAVRAGRGTPVVVANGEEGEPTSVKDRWLLRHRPHLVLDGLVHAATAVGADRGYVYLSDGEAERSVREALAEQSPGLDVRVVAVDPAYVAGEETAAVQAIGGGPAVPTDKPPRPFESGVEGRPTLVSNVETLANLPVLARLGAAEYRAVGTAGAPGTFLLTLGGRVGAPGLYEVPHGTTLGAALAALGGGEPAGFLMGGYFAGLLGPRGLDLPLDPDALAAAGSGLGCGAVTVLGPQDCPVGVAADVMAYFARENAAQCGSCFNGTAAMAAVLADLRAGRATAEERARLEHWSVFLRKRGACGTLDGAAQLAASLLREFPAVVAAHLDAPCPACRDTPERPARPFAVDVPGASTELLGS